MKRKSSKKRLSAIRVIIYIVLMCVCVGAFASAVSDCNRYLRVKDNPVKVTGYITAHDSYTDSEGDTDYYSYVSYEVNGVEYKNVEYQTKGNESSLANLGEEVEIMVNPENHGELMDSIANPYVTAFFAVMLSLGLALAYNSLFLLRISAQMPERDETEILKKDLKCALLGKTFRPFLLFVTIFMVAFCMMYPTLFMDGGAVVAVITGVWWSVLAFRVYRNMAAVKNEDYEIRRDTLLKKTESTDSDGDTSYYLEYSGRNGTWTKSVSLREFVRAHEGFAVYSVYIAQNKRPSLCYDVSDE